MKKVLLVAAVAGLSFVSCKKEYTCECTITQSANGQVIQTANSTTTIKDKEADAKSTCEASNNTTEANGMKSVTECKIK